MANPKDLNNTTANWADVNKNIPMDAILKDGVIIFVLKVPGLDVRDLVIDATSNKIEISGVFRNPVEGDNYLISEITDEDHWGEFQKHWEVEERFDQDKIGAVIKDGILIVTAPLATSQEKKRIDVTKR
jgi:HSP20 family molecular chaperone IbpA